MVARNDITGDAIQTKGVSGAYRDHYDNIFRKDKQFGKCGCGRSPNGNCIGWHSLTEEEYQVKLEEYNQHTQEDNK